MHYVDHIFIVLLFIVQPIYGAYAYRGYVAKIEAGGAQNRIKEYRQTMALEWVAFAVVAGAWALLSRPITELGFVSAGGPGFWGGALALILLTAYLVYSIFAAKKMSDADKSKQIDGMGKLRYVLPQDSHDYRSFVSLSLTAGIVEEFLYRGFTFWYLAQFMPIWAVVIVSSVAFGLAHSYQGVSGMLRVTLIGLAFGAFYVWTGSIWLPMLAHAILDVAQGAAIVEMFRHSDNSPETAPNIKATMNE